MIRAARPYDGVKRAIDMLVASVAAILTSPLQLVIAMLVKRDVGRPILFRQQRPGRDGRPFTLMKFRTMTEADPSQVRDDDAARLTRLGAFLRRTSLDELPSLWNVVRGDMSLVGPRPLLMSYLPLYTPEQARRHEVRPGLTGLAQVAGRNLVEWEERLRLDVEYVDTRGFLLDLRILADTVRLVLRREGVSGVDSVTMRPFSGTAQGPYQSNSQP